MRRIVKMSLRNQGSKTAAIGTQYGGGVHGRARVRGGHRQLCNGGALTETSVNSGRLGDDGGIYAKRFKVVGIIKPPCAQDGLFSMRRAPLTTLARRPASPIDNIAPLRFDFKHFFIFVNHNEFGDALHDGDLSSQLRFDESIRQLCPSCINDYVGRLRFRIVELVLDGSFRISRWAFDFVFQSVHHAVGRPAFECIHRLQELHPAVVVPSEYPRRRHLMRLRWRHYARRYDYFSFVHFHSYIIYCAATFPLHIFPDPLRAGRLRRMIHQTIRIDMENED
jgi:hypothetical protein